MTKCPECNHEHNPYGDPYAGQCFAQIDADYRTCCCIKVHYPSLTLEEKREQVRKGNPLAVKYGGKRNDK